MLFLKTSLYFLKNHNDSSFQVADSDSPIVTLILAENLLQTGKQFIHDKITRMISMDKKLRLSSD